MTTARDLAEPLAAEAIRRLLLKRARPTDDDGLREWLARYLGMVLPERACCDEHVAPFRAFADAYFARSSMAVWLGSRGFAGKSYTLAALALCEAATLDTEVRVLGGSAEQSENVVRYTDGWTARPVVATMLAGASSSRQAGVTRTRVRLAGGGMVDALAASTKAVRGPHPTRLRIDEADELSRLILDAALGQTMSRGEVSAQTVISSTHHYPDGTMTDVLRRATDRGWPVYRWCYRCTMQTDENPTGWLDPAEVDRKRRDVPSAMWAAEYDLQEPTPESRAIMPEAVDAMFSTARGKWAGSPGQRVEVEPPDPHGRYATGADWAKDVDWTVIVTLRYDVRPVRLVAYQRVGRMPYPQMAARYDDQVARYRGKTTIARHDKTGVGNAVHDLLRTNALGVVLTGRTRNDILGDYIAAVENGAIEAPMIDHAYGEHKFASVDDVYGSGHLPDSICALALAWSGAGKQRVGRLVA